MWKKGDRFEVTSPAAPFHSYRGVVDEVEAFSPYPVVTTVKFMDGTYTVSFREHEITDVAEIDGTAEIPVVVA